MKLLKEILIWSGAGLGIMTAVTVAGLYINGRHLAREITKLERGVSGIAKEIAIDLYFPVGINPTNNPYTNQIQPQNQNKVPSKAEYQK